MVYIVVYMKRTNIYLPDQLLARLRALAERTGLSVADLVRRAVEEYLMKREKEK